MTAIFTPAYRGGAGEPLVLLHGFTDTWRTWDLVLPHVEAHHDVLAPTLPGHAGGPALRGAVTDAVLPDAIERAMDEAGIQTAHLVGNSLGGFVALQLAARGRARSVVAFAPAGGWPPGDPLQRTLRAFFTAMHTQVKAVAPQAGALMATDAGRRQATQFITVNYEHLAPELLVHQLVGAAACDARPLLDHAADAGWELDAEHITCPVRLVWGTEDRLLPWPSAAARYRERWLPLADWVTLDGVGHCPQLDVPVEAAALILDFTRG